MTRSAGIDIGSRTVKVALFEDGVLAGYRIADTGTDPLGRARELLAETGHDPDSRSGIRSCPLVATGYGRHLAREALGCTTITEIKAHALGAAHLFPACRTVIDVGGQDSKVIRVQDGAVREFEMNDRCAAGTGRFLEVMAHALHYSIQDFAQAARLSNESVSISSMCTVFAESEVISLIARGETAPSIARGLHRSVVSRLSALVGRVGCVPEVVFSGGVALNPCIVELLQELLGCPLRVPEAPQIVGALGAALAAAGLP
jgi:predicted CoA-substrate-specific enzyme activase